jgi:hypothetical protein
MSILKSVGLLLVSAILFPTIANANVEGNTTPFMDVTVEVAPIAVAPAPASVEVKPTVVEKVSTIKAVKEVVSTVKAIKKNESVEKKGGLPSDSNLRLAIILGLIGIACLLLEALIGLGGVFWIIGSILLIVALVFLILWAVNQ